MPRPRVRPEQRQRSSKACNSCRASKIRCDAQLPCASCIRRDRPGSCTYPSQPSSPGRLNDTDRGQGMTPSLVSTSPTLYASSTSAYGVPQPSLQQVPPPAVPIPVAPDTDCHAHDSPRDRFLPGVNGDNVYIGDSASLSFLHFLRQALRPHVGATAFTDGEGQNIFVETEIGESQTDEVDLSLEDKRLLMQSYFEATSGLLNIFTVAEVDTFLEQNTTSASIELSKHDLAALDIAVAIGAQARASSAQNLQSGARYYERARQVAFEGMLADPSLSMVRMFVLLAFYKLGAGRQNAASIYIGVAGKSAIAIGLHQPMSWKTLHTPNGPDPRLRIWHSLCILDVLTSSLLARPITVPRATRHDINALPFDPNQPAFNSILKGAVLLDDVCRVLSRNTMIDVVTAEGLLENLRIWSRNLPYALRQFSCNDATSLTSTERQVFLGKVHVSSVYYFSVILVTRPFLIRYLMTKLRSRVDNGRGSTLIEVADPKAAELAHVCMRSAAYVGELCQKIVAAFSMSEFPVGNLCLFTTWTFGAGLILGFSSFAGEMGPNTQDSIMAIREVLSKISVASPQARLYEELLAQFSDTITQYRQQNSHKSHRTVDDYIDQILVIDVNQRRGDTLMPTPRQEGSSSWGAALNETFNPALTPSGPPNLDDEWFAQQNWNDIAMQFSDNFAVDFGSRI